MMNMSLNRNLILCPSISCNFYIVITKTDVANKNNDNNK